MSWRRPGRMRPRTWSTSRLPSTVSRSSSSVQAAPGHSRCAPSMAVARPRLSRSSLATSRSCPLGWPLRHRGASRASCAAQVHGAARGETRPAQGRAHAELAHHQGGQIGRPGPGRPWRPRWRSDRTPAAPATRPPIRMAGAVLAVALGVAWWRSSIGSCSVTPRACPAAAGWSPWPPGSPMLRRATLGHGPTHGHYASHPAYIEFASFRQGLSTRKQNNTVVIVPGNALL